MMGGGLLALNKFTSDIGKKLLRDHETASREQPDRGFFLLFQPGITQPSQKKEEKENEPRDDSTTEQ